MTKKTTRKIDARLVKDRVAFLKSNAITRKTFRSRADAVAFAADQMTTTGLDYDVKRGSRSAVLQPIDFEAVRESSDMRQIRDYLRLKTRSAHGRKARALEALGRRENFFDWPVGETPS